MFYPVLALLTHPSFKKNSVIDGQLQRGHKICLPAASWMAIASIMTSVVVIFIFPFDGQRCYYLASIIWAAAILVSNEFAVLVLKLKEKGREWKVDCKWFFQSKLELFILVLDWISMIFLARLPRIGALHERFGHFFVLKFWSLFIRFHNRHLPNVFFPALLLKEEALQSLN